MDARLESRRLGNEAPFNGNVLYADDDLSLHMLRLILASAVSFLESLEPDAALRTFDDWHDHDGIITASEPITWAALRTVVGSEQALLAARLDDTYVHRAYCPANPHFLLRFDVDNDGPEGSWLGRFDVTASPDRIAALLTTLPAGVAYRIEDAVTYFTERYAG